MPPHFKFLNVLSNGRKALFCPTQVSLAGLRQGSFPLHVAQSYKWQKSRLQGSSLSGDGLAK